MEYYQHAVRHRRLSPGEEVFTVSVSPSLALIKHQDEVWNFTVNYFGDPDDSGEQIIDSIHAALNQHGWRLCFPGADLLELNGEDLYVWQAPDGVALEFPVVASRA